MLCVIINDIGSIMELWRDTIEFQGKYQLLNISNPVLAFGKLKWIFSGRCFSQQPDSPLPSPFKHKETGRIIAMLL